LKRRKGNGNKLKSLFFVGQREEKQTEKILRAQNNLPLNWKANECRTKKSQANQASMQVSVIRRPNKFVRQNLTPRKKTSQTPAIKKLPYDPCTAALGKTLGFFAKKLKIFSKNF
jgi:hypothetical protein